MNKQNGQIERDLKSAMEKMAPNRLDELLLKAAEEGARQDMNTAAIKTKGELTVFPSNKEELITRQEGKAGGRAKRLARALSGVAAMLLVVFGAYFGYGHFSPQSVISLDVNPSVELKVNRFERVLSATPLNADANIILEGMDLKNVGLNVAVNALIGSMVKNGYISELQNSILISVDSRDAEKGQALKVKLSQEVDSMLSAYAVNGAVLSQTVSEDERLRELAVEHGITAGKAALVDQVVSQDDTLDFKGVAALPINDLNLLIESKKTALQNVEQKGNASSTAYIGYDKARDIALTHAGVSFSAVTAYEIELDYDDGRLIYEIEFRHLDDQYEYEIDAKSGAILEADKDNKGANPTHGVSPVSPPADSVTGSDAPATSAAGGTGKRMITLEKAVESALTHAGLKKADVSIFKQVSYEKQGQLIFDIGFKSATTKYSYLIDAYSGEVNACYTHALGGEKHDWDDDIDDNDSVINTSELIGAERAKSIALTQAGLSESAVWDMDIELDRDDGRVVYEVDFETADREYEFEIDAYTGAILWWE